MKRKNLRLVALAVVLALSLASPSIMMGSSAANQQKKQQGKTKETKEHPVLSAPARETNLEMINRQLSEEVAALNGLVQSLSQANAELRVRTSSLELKLKALTADKNAYSSAVAAITAAIASVEQQLAQKTDTTVPANAKETQQAATPTPVKLPEINSESPKEKKKTDNSKLMSSPQFASLIDTLVDMATEHKKTITTEAAGHQITVQPVNECDAAVILKDASTGAVKESDTRRICK